MESAIYADDLEIGQRISLGHYAITETEIIEYAQHWDPIFIHADPVAAAQSPFQGVIASGLHTLAIYQRLAVQALWSQIAGGIGRGFEIRFRRPVRPGATLTGHLLVQRVDPRGDGSADVTLTAELIDDSGACVLEVTNHSVLPRRPNTH